MHEFQSLSESSFTVEWDGRLVWSPSKPGLRFQAVRAAQPPGKTVAQRLRQMRAIAGSFTAWVDFHYAEQSRYELRCSRADLPLWVDRPRADRRQSLGIRPGHEPRGPSSDRGHGAPKATLAESGTSRWPP